MSLFDFFKNRKTELNKKLVQYEIENHDLKEKVKTLTETVMEQANIIDGYKRKEPNRDQSTGKFIPKPVVS